MRRSKKMVVNALIILLLIQNWFDWLNNDLVGLSISKMVFVAVFSIVMYFACAPLMLRKLQDIGNTRDEDVTEWETDS